MQIKEQIQKLLTELNQGVIEKETVIASSLLSAIAGESIFLLGAPGIAKSLIARRLKFAFKEANSFEYLMNRFSTPDEIFGPVSISKLKDEDKYERIVKNYLPSATIVFLDEIWKAGPSIQNALLTILNEKIYRNGEQEITVPIKALISASNELPAQNEGLEALWDRFLVRQYIDGVQNPKNFNDLISKPLKSYEDNIPTDIKITDEQYSEIQQAIDEIEIPQSVFNIIHVVRNYINDHNKKEQNAANKLYVSDRRWRKIVRLLRTSALLNDRKSVDLMDCFLIRNCIWDTTQQINTVFKFVEEAIQKHGYKLNFNLKDIKDQITDLETEIKEETKFVKDTIGEELAVFGTGTSYYEVEETQDQYKYIAITDYQALTDKDTLLYRYSYQNNGFHHYHQRSNARKGSKTFTIFLDAKEYLLKTQISVSKRETTKKPHKATENHWDEIVAKILSVTTNLKEQLETYRNEDLRHLRTNLFVLPELADIVETHITDTRKEIDKLAIEIRRIQNDYKALKDAEVIIK